MTEILSATATIASVAADSPLDMVCDGIRAALSASRCGVSEGRAAALATLEKIDALIASTPVLRERLRATLVPASNEQIVEQFTLLIASKPDEWDRATKMADSRKFSELWSISLLEDIATLNPSAGAMAIAGRRLRLDRKPNDFHNRRLPPSSEIADEIINAESYLATSLEFLDYLPSARKSLQRTIDDSDPLLDQKIAQGLVLSGTGEDGRV
jgi:hypothetical protein